MLGMAVKSHRAIEFSSKRSSWSLAVRIWWRFQCSFCLKIEDRWSPNDNFTGMMVGSHRPSWPDNSMITAIFRLVHYCNSARLKGSCREFLQVQPIVPLDHQACLDLLERGFLLAVGHVKFTTRHLTLERAAFSVEDFPDYRPPTGKIEGLHWDH